MHEFNPEVEALADDILRYSLLRLRQEPPLDHAKTPEELLEVAGNTITDNGLGGKEALRIFTDVLAPSCLSTDHPSYLAFIPSAPSEHATLFDLVVGASAIYGGSWLEGAGAVFAENQALRWISDLAGLPESAGGVFVQGGTIGNLSALVAARHTAREKAKSEGKKVDRWVIVASNQAHSSIKSAAEVMDCEVLFANADEDLVLRASSVDAAIEKYMHENPSHQVFALVGTAGSTNLGIIDDLDSLGDYSNKTGIWFHVDGAYGLAALCAPSVRQLFNGVEKCDSMIVDPHKWLFAPFDACALIYRNPALGKAAHTQHASYLDTLEDENEFNPSDYAIHLTRRPRGLPFWFSLAANGSKAYSEAVEDTINTAKIAVRLINEHPNLELLMDPQLSIVAFTRKGWSAKQYQEWSDKLLDDQIAFVTPSAHQGKPILRFAIVNPWTSEKELTQILATL
ncbi:MAG: aminotransferase class V-fold PLP-dependent enzyme [Actinomycetes bacterium]